MTTASQIRHARKLAVMTARMSMKNHIKRMPLPELTNTSESDFEAHKLTFAAGARAMRDQILEWDYDSGPSLESILRAESLADMEKLLKEVPNAPKESDQ